MSVADELFMDALEEFNFMRKSENNIQKEDKQRSILPSEKNPDVKFGIWDVIKDSIGQDISQITVPVFFNEPLSVL
jgi:hypothetical protein